MSAEKFAEKISKDNGTATSSYQLQGLSGRTLTLNPNWNNPTGSYRLGMKRAFELYPRQLISRVKEERKKKWMEVHKSIEAQIQKDLLQSTTKTGTDNIDIEELKTRMMQLRSVEKDMEDPGPLYDCLVFHDGERWQALIDTSETGDMSNKLPMSEYRHAHEYARFSELDALNYCVNIFDNGSTLSIVVDAGSHGSHVAGITAAYHPDQPELNGVAPGAQIISLKIGDSRLGSMETGVGLIRGLIEAIKRGCHIVNMSYGEATKWDNYGEYVKQAEVMVRKHGIIFVSSAGNNGPAISTVGCPGGTSSCCIGVGAFCTQSLMTAAYSMRKLQPESTYTWSSVGPTLDGDLGVSIMAPGGAVTSVPTWTGARSQLMNGTSMSSPNATGCIALLLSAALTQNIKISPMSMKKIVENSAKMIADVDVLGQGHGLLQVQSAWDLILASKAQKWADVFYTIKIGSERFERGIYLRQPLEVSQANSFNVAVEPVFHESFTSAQKTDFEVRFVLRSTASWVQCADRMLVVKGGKSVALFLDPTKLSQGVHVAFVRGYDEAHMELGE
jgi:tripeptidyl-peptidase-2